MSKEFCYSGNVFLKRIFSSARQEWLLSGNDIRFLPAYTRQNILPESDLILMPHNQTPPQTPADLLSSAFALRSSICQSINGEILIPGDKSISHRALILGSLAIGTTRVSGLLKGADVMSTLSAMRQLGVDISEADNGDVIIHGVGLHGLTTPDAPLDLGNAGTGARLLMGVIAGQRITASFTGDSSLSARPMRRVTDPLEEMGAQVSYLPENNAKGLLPVIISGATPVLPADYHSTIASAQIKSAILLAGLNARGTTKVTEPHISRDHTEAMLRHFGLTVEQTILADGRHEVSVKGEGQLRAADIAVPRDPSSAAFAMVAALIIPHSHITLPGISMNPQRIGLIATLQEMGGSLSLSNHRIEGGEDVADIEVRSSRLHGIDVPALRAASMIDEYPILSIAAACASGKTHMVGVSELRVKETDRIAVMAEGLRRCGVEIDETDDTMTVLGTNSGGDDISAHSAIAGGVIIASQHDHRIAMSFLTLGMVSKSPIIVEDVCTIATSFPGFAALMNHAGAKIERQS